MTATESNTQPPQRARSRVGSVVRITGAVLAVVLVVAWFMYPAPKYRGAFGHHLFHLLPIGWVGFLSRTLPGVTLNTSALALAGAVALLLAAMLNRAGRWLTPQWSWRSSLVALLVPMFLFIIAMSASGTYTRVIELQNKEGRWSSTGPSLKFLEDLRQIDSAIDAYQLNSKPAEAAPNEPSTTPRNESR